MNEPTRAPDVAVRRWLQRQLGTAAAIDLQPMPGATSSAVYRVVLAGEPYAVLRLFTDAAWLLREPDLADHEAAALQHAERRGLPAPRLIAVGRPGEAGIPAVLTTHLQGRIELRPRQPAAWLDALADTLAGIHAAGCEGFGWHYSSWAVAPPEAEPGWFGADTLWQRMRRIWERGAPPYNRQLLHRDFHPVNVLWHGATPSAVVDWVNACCGPAAVDVAHCRANLALMYGQRRADAFLQAYRRRVGKFQYDPFWDIDEVLGGNVERPTYYPPWRIFGLRRIGPHELQARLRRFLASAVAQYG